MTQAVVVTGRYSMEATLSDLRDTLDSIKKDMHRGGCRGDCGPHEAHCEGKGRTPQEFINRLLTLSKTARADLEHFKRVDLRHAEAKMMASLHRHANLQSRLDRLRRQHDILGIKWHESLESCIVQEARDAAANALFGQTIDSGHHFENLQDHDQARFASLFRENLSIKREGDRAAKEYNQRSLRRLLADREAIREDHAILEGQSDSESSLVKPLRAWTAYFRQLARLGGESDKSMLASSEIDSDEGYPKKPDETGLTSHIADRLCFDVDYKCEDAKEILTFRTRCGSRSARICIESYASECGRGSKDLTTIHSDIPLTSLRNDGPSFLHSERPSALSVSSFICGIIWEEIVPKRCLETECSRMVPHDEVAYASAASATDTCAATSNSCKTIADADTNAHTDADAGSQAPIDVPSSATPCEA